MCSVLVPEFGTVGLDFMLCDVGRVPVDGRMGFFIGWWLYGLNLGG